MNRLAVHFIYVTLLAALALLSLSLIRANRRAGELVRENLARTESLNAEMAGRHRDEVLRFMARFRETSGRAFSDVLEKLTLYRSLSARSENTLKEKLEERAALMEKLRNEPDLAPVYLREIVDLDTRILKAYGDYAALQELHRQDLFRRLEPVAEQAGLKSPS